LYKKEKPDLRNNDLELIKAFRPKNLQNKECPDDPINWKKHVYKVDAKDFVSNKIKLKTRNQLNKLS